MSLLRSNLAVASGTALSRLTGFIRVALLGFIVGQTGLTDAYNQANATPNLIYELLLGGVLSATLVPLFTRLSDEGDDEGTAAVVSVAVVLTAIITVVAVVAAPWIFRLYSLRTAATVDADVYRHAGTLLARIFLVQIFFYALNALGTAMLQARRRFFAAAWAPVLSNIVIIASLLLVPSAMSAAGKTGQAPSLTDVITDDRLRWTLGLGATGGIAVMAIALLPSLRSVGVPLRFTFQPKHPAVQRLRSLSGWALGYVVANQVAILVIQYLVRPGNGDQDAYTRAFTLFVLPHGLLGVSIATTFLPGMSSAIGQRNKTRLISQTTLGLRMIGVLTIPAGFLLFTLRRPIIGAAFQWKRFSPSAADLTSRGLAGFAIGLGAFSIYLFVLRVFYAHHDARTPFIINCGENLLNIVFAVILVERYGVMGLAIAFALAYIVAAAWALQVLSYKVPGFPIRPVLASLGRTLLASVVMAEVTWIVARNVGANAGAGAFVRCIVGGLTAVVVFVGVLAVLGGPELDEIRRRLPGRDRGSAEVS